MKQGGGMGIVLKCNNFEWIIYKCYDSRKNTIEIKNQSYLSTIS